MNIPFTLEELEKAGEIAEFLDGYCETLHKVLKHPNNYDGWKFDGGYIQINNYAYGNRDYTNFDCEYISFEGLFDMDALIEARLAEIAREEEERRLMLERLAQSDAEAREEMERQEYERLKKKFA